MTDSKHSDLFAGALSPEAADIVRKANPHWENKPGPITPQFRRWIFARLLRLLKSGFTPGVVLRGPRRVGKTILVRQLIEQLLSEGVAPQQILYLPFDELESLKKLKQPVLSLAHWFEAQILASTFNEAARTRKVVYLFLDEVQNLQSWAPQIKHLVDNNTVRILVTGSSSLRIAEGQDSLAGRISTVDLGPMLLREIAGLGLGATFDPIWQDNGGSDLKAQGFWQDAVAKAAQSNHLITQSFSAFSQRGAYPIAHEHPDTPWPELASYLNETVIRRAIQHDLRMGERGKKRDERLLEEVFRLSCRYAGQAAGQSVFVPELQHALAANIGWLRILSYLKFLDGTLLLRLINPLELRLKRRKGASKACLCDHALRASWLQEQIPLDPEELAAKPHLSDLAGHIAESALGYYLATIPNIEVAWFPERGAEPEVDFVITVGDRRIPVELKYQRRIDPNRDTRGLRAFMEKTVYNAPFGLLVTQSDGVTVPDPRIVPISLATFLWLR